MCSSTFLQMGTSCHLWTLKYVIYNFLPLQHAKIMDGFHQVPHLELTLNTLQHCNQNTSMAPKILFCPQKCINIKVSHKNSLNNFSSHLQKIRIVHKIELNIRASTTPLLKHSQGILFFPQTIRGEKQVLRYLYYFSGTNSLDKYCTPLKSHISIHTSHF